MPPNVVIEKRSDGRLRVFDRNTNAELALTESYTAKKTLTSDANHLRKITGWPIVDVEV